MLRLTGGRVLNRFRGGKILLLTSTGRRTGNLRTWPLLYLDDGDGFVVVGSNGGHDHDPAWCLNLRAEPAASVDVEGKKVAVRARFARGAERAEWWDRFIAAYVGYADYQGATDREIPVVMLEPGAST
ncbi:MAG: nitroreductase family deazaflavin-dependent oxidoreductase, partial [Acidimicrobiia bacterium]